MPSLISAVIFDISGTTIDFGSRAPVTAFLHLFASHRVQLTEAEARRPMGLHKRDHVRAILADPTVIQRWTAAHGAPPTAATVDQLYAGFAAIQREAVRRHLDVLPGVAEVCAELRLRGIPFACTTGFESSMLVDLIPAAASQGFAPGCWMTPDQCGGGRPAPWMIYAAARQLGAYPLSRFVKVGDTPADIEEARNAGVWSVAVTVTGNQIGLSREEWTALPPDDQSARIQSARDTFQALGAHEVIDGVAALLPALAAIERRIEQGEKP